MVDVREQILVRLGEILATVEGIEGVTRNDVQKSDVRTMACYLDSDEEADEDDNGRGRPNNTPRRVSMSPEIYILLAKRTEDVGSVLNGLRMKVMAAILNDEPMKTILGQNGKIEYEGCATDLARGRTMIGEMGIAFDFHYILRPSDLT